MTFEVAANTRDLTAFTEGGTAYRSTLRGIFQTLESRHATVSSALGHAPSGRWIDAMREMIAEATFNDRFVETVRDALVDFTAGLPPGARPTDGMRRAPVGAVDAALEETGLATDGADRSLVEDLLAVMSDEQLSAYQDLVLAGVPPLQAEMLVISDDPEAGRYVDGVKLELLNARIEGWDGPRTDPAYQAMLTERRALISSLAGDDRTWRYDPEVLAVAAQNGLAYDEADFALTAAEVDALGAELYGGAIHPYGPDPVAHEAFVDAVDRLAEGDEALAREIRSQVARGVPAADALFNAVDEVYGDEPIGTLLDMLETRGGDPNSFDPIGFALQATALENVEEFTGADASEVNLGIAVMAQDNDITYNTAVAMINLDIAAEDSEWPSGSEPFAYLDVPITDGVEAAYLLMADEEGLFRVIETANQGNTNRWDGKLSDSDWAAVLEDPDSFSTEAVAIAEFFSENPEEWLAFDTARDGVALTSLSDGRYGVGDGDGTTSFADVQQYVTNRYVFDTLIEELERDGTVLVDADGNGRFDAEDFEQVLHRVSESHPNYESLTEAVQYALDADMLDEPDTRAWYEQIGDGVYRIGSLTPGSPFNLYRAATDPRGLADDYWSFARGAGEAVVGIGLFAYDLSAIAPTGPGFWVEYARTGGDMNEHRGWQLAQALPSMADAGLSLMPGTPQHASALAEVRRQGTWDAHPGLNLGLAVVDWETFVDDPARWAGQFAPDVLITVLTGGGGAITRFGSTGSRVANGFRRIVTGVSGHGLRHSLRTGGTAVRAAFRNRLPGLRGGDDLVEYLYRGDGRPFSPVGSQAGRRKSYVDPESGDLLPANPDGRAGVHNHVRGSEPLKSDSPFTSFSTDGDVAVGYGGYTVRIDRTRLAADIDAGRLPGVRILEPPEIVANLQRRVDDAKARFDANPTARNQERLDRAELDLSNTLRDSEYLVEGIVPSEYVTVIEP